MTPELITAIVSALAVLGAVWLAWLLNATTAARVRAEERAEDRAIRAEERAEARATRLEDDRRSAYAALVAACDGWERVMRDLHRRLGVAVRPLEDPADADAHRSVILAMSVVGIVAPKRVADAAWTWVGQLGVVHRRPTDAAAAADLLEMRWDFISAAQDDLGIRQPTADTA